jgi:SAM-dependent methyltransferase
MPTNTNLSILKNIDLYKDRAKNVDLIWCNQVTSLIEQLTDKNKQYNVNDIGCNYGQLYKELIRNKIEKKYHYRGYDIDKKFLEIAKENFSELNNKVSILNIETETPPSAQITICSATFEHLDNPFQGLNNLFESTTQHLILRTFVGTKNIRFIQSNTDLVDHPYNVNQFELYEMSQKFFEKGFNFCCIPDHATGMSNKYEVSKGSGVIRQMFIILGSRTNK